MNATIKKIENIFRSPYDNRNFVNLANEIFPNVRLVAPDKFRKEFSNYSSHIDGSIHVGNYVSPDNKNILIMAVKLINARYVENSRSTQRSYARKLIQNGNADAAFIAFYTENDPKWRLSLVRLDYEMKIENGRLRTAENMTPAKRFSYLVGQDEPCHTAINRFKRFITDNQVDPEHPTLDDLEETFSVEKVTKEFFQLYCEKFLQLTEFLEANEDFCIEAEQHNFNSSQFAKKLMGQIVFLYFLQKKGWLGVKAWPNSLSEKEYKNAFFASGAKSRELIPIIYRPIDDGTYRISNKGLKSISDSDEEVLAMCVKGNPWGSGPYDFMRRLFVIAEKKNINFFNELLQPLFYDALNKNRGEQSYCSALHCRIPFLSGGLFEPIDGYDWKHNNFAIPNEVFSNVNEKARDADGILDIFDRYNFTMNENEPMEHEVAIDPEMLGKVFENLLEVKDRKSKGAFYTPREIVHYMCQESLINYLTNSLDIKEAVVRDFILYGDFMKDEDTVKEKRQGNGGLLIDESLYKIESDGTISVNRLKEMDFALASVRIADPAVGSGAFPLGMLNEVVRARQNISAYYSISMKPYDIRMMYHLERSPHTLKYETIKNCIFAADIDPSAVDITKLRLWLSLVIDDEINPEAQTPLDGHRNPLPLPNLESNILCGNSLIDEFEGITLTINKQTNITQERYDMILQKLIEKQDELFKCDNTESKKSIKEEIDNLRDMIIMTRLEGSNPQTIQKYYESKSKASKPYILWQLDFARVFREKYGFDIVLGNPPYIDSENMVNSGLTKEREYITKNYSFAKGNWDIYIAFFEKGFNLLRKSGLIIYITPDKWISKPFGDALRIALIGSLKQILVAGRDVFQSALVDSIITMFTKREHTHMDVYKMDPTSKRVNMLRVVNKNILTKPYALDIVFSDYIDLVEKINKGGLPLKNHCICENACSTSDCYVLKDILFSLEDGTLYDKSLYRVINTGTIGKYVDRWGLSPMRYLKDKYQYPVVLRDKFLETFPNTYGAKAAKKKIIIKGLTLLDGSIDFEGNIIPGKSTMIIPINDDNQLRLIASFINSKITLFYIKQKYSSSSYNGGINFSKDMINDLPFPAIDEITKKQLLSLVDILIDYKKRDENIDLISEAEQKIDAIYYDLFNLTKAEIDSVEQAFIK